jgi:transposase-like protein
MTSPAVRMSAAPTTEVCPNCYGQMTVIQVMPTLFTDGLESVTYKCAKCRSELERTFLSTNSKPTDHLAHPEPSGGLWRRGGFERVC